jgi:molecular chaperone IbpA
LAGFSHDEISVTAEQNVVTIEGNRPYKAEGEYLYRGISARPFKRQFSLADYVNVKNAVFENGLLKLELLAGNPRGHEAPADYHQWPGERTHQLEAKAA